MLEEMGIPITTEQGRYGGPAGPRIHAADDVHRRGGARSLGLIAARGLGRRMPLRHRACRRSSESMLPSAPRKTIAALRESVALQAGEPGTNADAKLLRVLSESQSRTPRRYATRRDSGSPRATSTSTARCSARALVRGGPLPPARRAAHAAAGPRRPCGRLGREFVRPAEFDAAAYLTRALATLPRGTPVEVLLLTDLARARRELPESMGLPEVCEGGVLLRGSADELDWYARELMRLPFRFEVRSPVALKQSLARLAAEFTKQFA
jgi:hypothetical protein